MALQIKPETAAALEALASAKGLSVADFLEQIVNRESQQQPDDSACSEQTGMVWENGLYVYRTGRPLPMHVIDDAVRKVREERTKHISDQHS
jgi:methionine salvage enolase-phosphatase E1